METWTPPTDAVETSAGWTPPNDAVEAQTPTSATAKPKIRTDIALPNAESMQKASSVVNPVGIGETALQIGSGLASTAVGGLVGLVGSVLPGPEGQGAKWSQAVQHAGTYEPRTEAGKTVSGAVNTMGSGVAHVFKEGGRYVGKQYGLENEGEFAGEMYPVVASIFGLKKPVTSIANTPYTGTGIPELVSGVKSALPTAPIARTPATKEALAVIQQQRAAAASEADWARAPIIEAGKIGAKRGYLMNPARTNPSFGASVNDALVNGEYVNAAISIKNAPKFNADTREAFGIKPNTHLDQHAYQKAANDIAAPYKALDKVVPDAPAPDLLSKLRDVGVSDVMGTDVAAANATRALASSVEKALVGKTVRSNLDPGIATTVYPSTNTILKTISDMRLKASDTFNSAKFGQISSSERAIANARREIADILEQHLETIAPPELVPKMIEARTKLAQLRKFEDATDFATGQVHPKVFANEMAGKHNLTGLAAEMGTFAANLPEFADVVARQQGAKIVLPSRSGVTGTLGYAAATAAGGSGVVGSVIGAGAGSLGGKLKLKKMLSEEFQKKYAAPMDRRIPDNGMLTGNTP